MSEPMALESAGEHHPRLPLSWMHRKHLFSGIWGPDQHEAEARAQSASLEQLC